MIQNLKKFKSAAAGLVAVLLFVLGAFVGRATVPVRIDEKVQIKTVEVEKIKVEWRDRIVEKTVYVKVKRKNVVTEQREVIRPDGTIERQKVETIATETNVTTAAVTAAERVATSTQERVVEQVVKAEKTVTAQRNWNLALMVGVAPRASFMPPLIPPPVIVGIYVQKKILGPVTLGGWALTSPGAGVSLGIEF